MPPTDPDLDAVRALQAGDERALDELMGKYKGPLFGVIYRSTGDQELSRDLLQETFVRCYFGINQFKPKAKFVTWLYSIALNLCRDYARSRRHREARMTQSFTEADLETQSFTHGVTVVSPDKEVESREALDHLGLEISQLPPDLRSALVLFALEGRSQQECAEILRCSPKAVETRVHRARKILEKKLRPLH